MYIHTINFVAGIVGNNDIPKTALAYHLLLYRIGIFLVRLACMFFFLMFASNDSSIMMLGVTFQRRLDGSFDGNARFASLSHRHGFVLLSRFMGKDSSLSRLVCKDSLLLVFTFFFFFDARK